LVPWQSLRHAFGDAREVPRQLRELASGDRELRQTALKDLFACLLHQGSVYEATARAVPFLFELLADPATPERSWLAFLLASIGDGQGYLKLHIGADEQRWRQLLVERGTTLEAELQREDEVVRGVRLAIGRGVEHLVPFLSDGQSEIRAAVARALGQFPARAAELLPALEAADASETATDAKEALRQSLAKLRPAQ
jgi:HEAT repeat protein